MIDVTSHNDGWNSEPVMHSVTGLVVTRAGREMGNSTYFSTAMKMEHQTTPGKKAPYSDGTVDEPRWSSGLIIQVRYLKVRNEVMESKIVCDRNTGDQVIYQYIWGLYFVERQAVPLNIRSAAMLSKKNRPHTDGNVYLEIPPG